MDNRPDLLLVHDEPPVDYPRPFRFIPSATRPTIGERLVLFFRLNGGALSFWFAMTAIVSVIGAVVGAYLGVAL